MWGTSAPCTTDTTSAAMEMAISAAVSPPIFSPTGAYRYSGAYRPASDSFFKVVRILERDPIKPT